MKLLFLNNHRLSDSRHEAVQKGERPKADHDALAAEVCAQAGGQADILDRNSVEREGGWLIRLVRRLFGYHTALALLASQRCHHYDAVYSDSDFVALPLALLIGAWRSRPRHVTTAYYLTGKRNTLCHRLLKAHRGMDTIFTLSREQYETGRELKIPESKLVFLESCGYLDAEFFNTETEQAVNERQICSTGLEFRDYDTLLAAVAELPLVKLKIDPASPWSLQRSAVDHSRIPPNAEIVHMKLGDARPLYAESAAVVVPLRANPMGAGTFTMVEAMLMGKPVIVTRSRDGSFAGRQDLVDGEHVIMVNPGDVSEMRNAIERLMTDKEVREQIGKRGRLWALQHTNREQWLKIMMGAFCGAAKCDLPLSRQTVD